MNNPDPINNRRPEAPETLLRHWNLLTLLPTAPGKATVSSLLDDLEAAGFKTTDRTLQRDLNKLALVFGIENDGENPPGWYWSKAVANHKQRLPILNNQEALTFILVKQYLANLLPASVLEHLDPFIEQAEKTLLKQRQNSLKDWPQKIAAVPASQPLLPPTIKSDVQRTVSDALLREKMLSLQYQSRAQGEPEVRVVHPLSMVTRGGMVYLVAAVEHHEEIAIPREKIRLRAMHRIHAAEMLDQPVRVPEGFDLDHYIATGELGFGQGETITLKAAFTSQAAQHLHDTRLTENQTIEPYDEGRVLVTAELPKTQQLTWWLLGFGDKVEVLEPIELRTALATIAEGMCRRYGRHA